MLLPCTQIASAQNIAKTETKDIFLTVTETFKSHDTIIVFLGGGSKNIGLEHRHLAKAYQSSSSAVPGISEARELREVASGKILFLDTFIAARVICYDPKDTLEYGDLISVKLNIPVLPYRSIFSELAFKNILFTNTDQDRLYFLQTVINNESNQEKDSIFNIIEHNFHYIYKKVNS